MISHWSAVFYSLRSKNFLQLSDPKTNFAHNSFFYNFKSSTTLVTAAAARN